MPDRISHPARSGWWSLLRFGLWVTVSSLIFTLMALPWVELSWWMIFRRCVSIGSLVSLWLLITKFERRSFLSYGLSLDGNGRQQFWFGVLLGLGALVVLFGVGLFTGACQISITPDRVRLWRTLLGFIPLGALVGVLEELVFRGYILQHLLSHSRQLAITVSSALYALVHLRTTTFNLLTFLELGGLFLLGLVLAVSYLQTKRLTLAVGLHASLAYGARVNKLLIAFTNPSLHWLTGTSRLVNGITSWVVLLLIGGVIVWWTRSSSGGGVRHEYS